MTDQTIRVVIPLAVRKKNGRPKILPPADHLAVEARLQDAHVLRAIARAWNWRRRLERGEASTIADIAAAERVADRFVSRMMRLAYLSPDVLEKLLIHRMPPALSLNDLIAVADLPWAEQMEVVFAISQPAAPEGLTTPQPDFTEIEKLAAVRRRGCQSIGEVMDGTKAEAASSGREAYPASAR